MKNPDSSSIFKSVEFFGSFYLVNYQPFLRIHSATTSAMTLPTPGGFLDNMTLEIMGKFIGTGSTSLRVLLDVLVDVGFLVEQELEKLHRHFDIVLKRHENTCKNYVVVEAIFRSGTFSFSLEVARRSD